MEVSKIKTFLNSVKVKAAINNGDSDKILNLLVESDLSLSQVIKILDKMNELKIPLDSDFLYRGNAGWESTILDCFNSFRFLYSVMLTMTGKHGYQIQNVLNVIYARFDILKNRVTLEQLANLLSREPDLKCVKAVAGNGKEYIFVFYHTDYNDARFDKWIKSAELQRELKKAGI